MQEVKDAKDKATRDLENEAQKVADDLDLELDKTAKLEWFKSNNVSLRCLRITPKEVRRVPLFLAPVLYSEGYVLEALRVPKELCLHLSPKITDAARGFCVHCTGVQCPLWTATVSTPVLCVGISWQFGCF